MQNGLRLPECCIVQTELHACHRTWRAYLLSFFHKTVAAVETFTWGLKINSSAADDSGGFTQNGWESIPLQLIVGPWQEGQKSIYVGAE